MYSINETIVALATPPGEGAIGVIRLSGADAIAIADKLFKGKPLSEQPGYTLHFGSIMDGATAVDEVVASLYRAPKSYTGEDVVEFSCHGSGYVLQQVIRLCISQGAVMAKPGEFTQRAFLNGKLDLTQAEAVADLIASQSGAAQQAAIHNLKGGFRTELQEMREELIKFSALIELELDFSQEDVEFADRTMLYGLVDRLTTSTSRLIQSFSLGNVIRNGVSVAIIGRPNAGKSTLLNALLNEERAIVSEIPGTTRDTIEEALNINGVIFRLIDTAGIRDHSADLIENIGMDRSREAMRQADVVIHLFDVAEPVGSLQLAVGKEDAGAGKVLLVGNKVDEPGLHAVREKFYSLLDKEPIFISAREKQNIQELKQALYDLVVEGNVSPEGTIVTSARHHAALQEVLSSLNDIKAGMDQGLPGDLISLDIRRCLYFLGEITGEVTTEDKLDFIFSKFCIGK
jgi:tRNA modification GTPase